MWINNAGLDGATTYRHLILMEDYLIKLRPKVVLFLVGINDVGAGDLDKADKPKGPYLRNLYGPSCTAAKSIPWSRISITISLPRAGVCITRKLT